MTVQIALALFLVHTVEGKPLYINPESVISLSIAGPLVTERAQCVIALDDAKFVTVRENCDQVRKLIEHPDAGGG
jgi:hypothetical protein